MDSTEEEKSDAHMSSKLARYRENSGDERPRTKKIKSVDDDCSFDTIFDTDGHLISGYTEASANLITGVTGVKNIRDLLVVRLRCRGIRRLCLHDEFKDEIETAVLPPELTDLTFGQSYNHPIERVVQHAHTIKTPQVFPILPETLQALTFGRKFNQPISEFVLPESLKKLVFGRSFNRPIGHILPRLTNLTHLCIGREFTETVDMQSLEKLKCLSVSEVYQHVQDLDGRIKAINATDRRHNRIEFLRRQRDIGCRPVRADLILDEDRASEKKTREDQEEEFEKLRKAERTASATAASNRAKAHAADMKKEKEKKEKEEKEEEEKHATLAKARLLVMASFLEDVSTEDLEKELLARTTRALNKSVTNELD